MYDYRKNDVLRYPGSSLDPLVPAEPIIVVQEVVREPEREEQEEVKRPPCPLSIQFNEWCHDNLLLKKDMTIADVFRDIVLVTKQYRVYLRLADRACRNHTEDTYTCIFHVWHTWLDRLERRELALIPSVEFFFERAAEEQEPERGLKVGEWEGEEDATKDEDEEQNW